VPPPVLVALAVGLGWLLRRLAPVPVGAPLPWPGAAVAGLGLGLSVWAIAVMLRAGTDPRPDRPDRALLERGPFRLGRNPVYLGFLLVAAGLALRWADLWPWLAVPAGFLLLDRLVVAREEAYLRARFGAAYDAYRARVRRWV
jgi:protein-S-isoprenylcysteine O-methyltransferase Ste14